MGTDSSPHSSPETPVPRAHASSLPDELLIRIFSQLNDRDWYSGAACITSIAPVCRRWLPAATQALYSTLRFDTFNMEYCLRLAQTLLNAPHLRQLVRTLHIYISSGADAPTVERLLGWTALVPPEPGFHFLKFNLHSDDSFATVLLARAPALRAVREMVLYGATTESLVAIPYRLERLTLELEIETAPLPLPPLVYLQSLKNTASHVVFEHALRNLRTLELMHMDLTV
ncbi:hypothetical protein EXIGLDRAFT_729453 [Exidia glandulosa HHB12029]|uniref:F-box domain-containing protein n=1 Tax=Exidia glandulosa HHB12029 TaxID=1314781 RepID=A0A165LJT3_EXIGL|nr:hypothetical protein EXIGLDRAFT_729453 [Exidia glandulosa HHB12029]